MQRAPFVLIFALVWGAGPARASEYPPPEPVQRAEPHAAPKVRAKKPQANRQRAEKQVAPKAIPAKTPTPLPKPAPQPKLANAEPAKPQAPKSQAVKTAIAKMPASASGVFAGIPPSERLKIQSALLWAGDYGGASAGEDPLLAAIKSYQKRIKAKITGELTPAERARLVAAAHDHERQFGWNVVVDPSTGVRIGLPGRLVPQVRDAARGTRWSSAHGEVQVETFRIKDRDLKLSALFEREKREPATRKVEYSVLRDDNFFVSGLQGLKKFSVRATLRDGEVRGFTMLFDQAMETIVAPVMVAMASAFSPFPERSLPFAALAKSVEYGNGLVVSARGHVVTNRRLTQGCQVIRAAGVDADLLADDKEKGLALLRVYGPHKLAPLALDSDSTNAGNKSRELTLIGMPEPKAHDGHEKLTEIKARLAESQAIELRQPTPMAGFSGAAAIDAQGRLIGLTEMRSFVLASIDPAAPPVRLVSAASIQDFLAAHHVPVAQAANHDAKTSVVRVICVRK